MTNEDIDLSGVKMLEEAIPDGCIDDAMFLSKRDWDTVNSRFRSEQDKRFKLCLVLDNQAWFTTQDITKQWGDDWDDAPYEHNAGPPYEFTSVEHMDCQPYEIKKVYWESDTWVIHHSYKMDSVETINANKTGGFGWLAHYHGDTFDEIAPGTTLEEFKKWVDVYERCEQ